MLVVGGVHIDAVIVDLCARSGPTHTQGVVGATDNKGTYGTYQAQL